MYESPIELVSKDIQYEIENDICKAVQKLEIKIDKEELVKALKYDRSQYEKGYEDGKNDSIVYAHWVDVEGDGVDYSCSNCGNYAEKDEQGNCGKLTNYCSNCGTKMDEKVK